MLDDFKKFVARGNVIDLGVAVIMGARFRRHRHLAGERRDHAAHRPAFSVTSISRNCSCRSTANPMRPWPPPKPPPLPSSPTGLF